MYHPSHVQTITNAYEKDLLKMVQKSNKNKLPKRRLPNIRTLLVALLPSLNA